MAEVRKVSHEVQSSRIITLGAMLYLCDGDPYKALAFAEKFNRVTITVSRTLVERSLIAWHINLGWGDTQIAKALSTEDYQVSRERVIRMRRKLKNEKQQRG
jgi:hypothetical protein